MAEATKTSLRADPPRLREWVVTQVPKLLSPPQRKRKKKSARRVVAAVPQQQDVITFVRAGRDRERRTRPLSIAPNAPFLSVSKPTSRNLFLLPAHKEEGTTSSKRNPDQNTKNPRKPEKDHRQQQQQREARVHHQYHALSARAAKQTGKTKKGKELTIASVSPSVVLLTLLFCCDMTTPTDQQNGSETPPTFDELPLRSPDATPDETSPSSTSQGPFNSSEHGSSTSTAHSLQLRL